jgi:hypothetical protein
MMTALFIGMTLIFAAGFLASAAGSRWMTSFGAPFLFSLGFGLLAGVLGLISALCAIRLIMRSPSLVIGPDGIFDNASMTIVGRGLLRWDEILAVSQLDDKRTRSVTYHYLCIDIADVKAVRQRQAPWKRLLALVAMRPVTPGSVTLIRALLDRSPNQLADEILEYVAQHAPTGWRSPLIMSAHKPKRHHQPSQAD